MPTIKADRFSCVYREVDGKFQILEGYWCDLPTDWLEWTHTERQGYLKGYAIGQGMPIDATLMHFNLIGHDT